MALQRAHDIRKFEIDLYWKRGTYFWTFIALAFAGYVAVPVGDKVNTYIVACVGFLFSLAWYLVNRGSAAWQRNWEAHVDALEDAITGPLHKVHMNRKIYKWYHLAEPYAFSPSRINNILALGVTFVWLLLLLRALAITYDYKISDECQFAIISGFVVVMLISLVKGGRPRHRSEKHDARLRDSKIV